MKFDRRLTDEIYTSNTVRLGKDAFQAMQETIYHNGGVGTIAGYYDGSSSHERSHRFHYTQNTIVQNGWIH